MNKRGVSKGILFSVITTIIIVIGLFLSMNHFYVDYLWFKSLGYTDVFMKEIVTKIQVSVPLFIISLLFFILYLKILTTSILKRILQVNFRPNTRMIALFSIVISFLVTTITTNSIWYNFLEFKNAVHFNVNDPLFNKDISFFIFQLPFLEQLLAIFIFILLLFAIVSILYTAFLYLTNPYKSIESVKNNRSSFKVWISDFGNFAGKEIGFFSGLFFFIMSFHYYIQSYTLVYSNNGIVYGASYIDANITLPLYKILCIVAFVAGVYSVINGFKRKIKRLIIGPILIIGINLVGSLMAIGVEQLIVAPNEYAKEEPYLVKNIKNTQAAYGIHQVEEKAYDLDDEINVQDIKDNQLTIDNIPINDYHPTLDMYNSIQGFRIYYEFNDVDIDRYDIDDKYTQVFISAREMNNQKLEDKAQNWINKHLKYTHGFGVAVSAINTINESGQPTLIVEGIPPVTSVESLQITEPRIYYGESTDDYVITNGKTMEFDYSQGSENMENEYDGTGGIPLNIFNRSAFALYHGDSKILLSTEINSQSKMHIRRNIMCRVNAIAPFLSYDEDPYIVVADGKLYWVIDGFTLSNRYPYSQPYNKENTFNYIRNSVKVVVDAYNGDVNFYQVDQQDAIINVYNKIYPGMFQPMAHMPESIREHIRYSQEIFDIQSNVYATYHMNNPKAFYNKQDQWEIANQVHEEKARGESIESTYLIMKRPEKDREEFILMIPYTPKEKDNLVGWMLAMNDKDEFGKLVVYKFTKQNLAYGPMQIEQRIDQDTNISPQLTLLGQQGSQIMRGNMFVIPIGNSILYVQPVYLSSSEAQRSLPEVKKVIVSYGNKIIMEDTLEKSLQKLFGTSQEKQEEPKELDHINGLIREANNLLKRAQEAQKSGNWTDYGKYIHQLGEVLEKLEED
ncbi:UPF0182 family protein [Alkalibaculum bacchi]|uniref:UPF0182 family membrane protein n=1 Tax=Alkalibaculum bacchi TaxID=645887 RepID=UPI0026EAD9AC|nr:UPF0182 family protein [Alkalibaculum bacchi]